MSMEDGGVRTPEKEPKAYSANNANARKSHCNVARWRRHGGQDQKNSGKRWTWEVSARYHPRAEDESEWNRHR